MPVMYEKLLGLFPFSQLSKQVPSFRIQAVAYSEPVVFEAPIALPVHVPSIMWAVRDFQNVDTCYELSASWDLWRWDDEWKLAPVPVELTCYGPEFDSPMGEHLRIHFGADEQFLPGGTPEAGLPMIRANIQSLLRLVHDVRENLPVEHLQLWSESGGNFAERLQLTLANPAEN